MGRLAIGSLCLAGLLVIYRSIEEIQRDKNLRKEDAKGTGEESVYILANPYFASGIFKIGYTKREVDTRMSELFTTGLPNGFSKCIVLSSHDARRLEKILHKKYSDKRINKGREFFLLSREDIDDISNYPGVSYIDGNAISNAFSGSSEGL
jgi:hypothetical protein